MQTSAIVRNTWSTAKYVMGAGNFQGRHEAGVPAFRHDDLLTAFFEAHDMTAPGATGKCAMTGSLVIEQAGPTLTGEYTIDRITCSGPGDGTIEGPITGPIVSGEIDGNKVHFHFDTEDLDQHGTVSGSRMTGTCTWRGEIDGWVTMTGGWSAQRM